MQSTGISRSAHVDPNRLTDLKPSTHYPKLLSARLTWNPTLIGSKDGRVLHCFVSAPRRPKVGVDFGLQGVERAFLAVFGDFMPLVLVGRTYDWRVADFIWLAQCTTKV